MGVAVAVKAKRDVRNQPVGIMICCNDCGGDGGGDSAQRARGEVLGDDG